MAAGQDLVRQLAELDRRHYLHPTTSLRDHSEQGPLVIMERGEGAYVYDLEGRRYLDGSSQLWNVNVGHGRAELAEAAARQMKKLAFASGFFGFSHEPVVRLAEMIASLAPGDLSVCFFTQGGSDANETAFKLARHYFQLKGKNKYKIIARHRGYHGVSLGATSATGIRAFRDMARPLMPGFHHAPAPYCNHCELGLNYPSCELACAANSIRQLIEEEGPDTVAAIILEPIQAAGGVIIPPPGYVAEVRRICDDYDVLMITDEVITGFGRTGRWFGVEHEGVVPDMMTFAKGVTSGYVPLGGVVLSRRLHEEMVDASAPGQVLAHGFTYSGHPVACAVGLKNIEILENEDLIGNADRMGRVLAARLGALRNNNPFVRHVMSRGLIASVELGGDDGDPPQGLAQRVARAALAEGLLTRPISIDNTEIIGLAPPLIVNEEQIDEMIGMLTRAIERVAQG